MSARVVVLVSGTGSNLAALIEACPSIDIVAVGSDRPDIRALEIAAQAGIPTFIEQLADYPDRSSWDIALAEAISSYSPAFVVCAGFMKILGPAVLDAFDRRIVNTHPALLPAFPGAHAVRDALAYGVTVTGATVHLVDGVLDGGPIISQVAVTVEPDDDEASLHARIKLAEQRLLVEVVGRMALGYSVVGRKVNL